MTVSSRIAVMNDGRVEQLGEPREVYEAPRTRYVAEFIGDVNVFGGHVGEDGALALDNGARVRLPEHRPAGARVEIAVRPEKMSLARRSGDLPTENALSGRVEDIAYLGDVSVYHVALDAGTGIAKATRTNRVRGAEGEITWGDSVVLGWDLSATVVLAG
jgi:putrescine transport system ATP-binding protein